MEGTYLDKEKPQGKATEL